MLRNDSANIPCFPWQVALFSPFACSNLRWGIGTLPQQSGVYAPRRLIQVNGSVAGASSDGASDVMSLPLSDRRRRHIPEAAQLGPADQVSGGEHGLQAGAVRRQLSVEQHST